MMTEISGKYGLAKIFTDNVDKETLKQVSGILDSPLSDGANVRIMPDCHAGAGCVIGTTMTIKDKVCPNIVGVDIGCGVLTTVIGTRLAEPDFKELDYFIKRNIPSGQAINEEESSEATKLFDSLICASKIANRDRITKSIGTLGGGNHFIEVDKSPNGCYYLLIHTGSRNLGVQVAKYYQTLATKENSFYNQEKRKLILQLKKENRHKDIENELLKFDLNHKRQWPEELDFLSGAEMSDYLHDMAIAQKFAEVNRRLISSKIMSYFGTLAVDEFDTIHNYIDMSGMTLRKGAVSAKKSQRLIIPINMRDGALICAGKGNKDWNESAPHGAGRILSRSQARKELDVRDFMKSVSGLYTTTATIDTIDESPAVYKPKEEIIKNIKDTVDIVSTIYPVYNFKAIED